MSFSPTALRRVRALAPDLPTVQLVRQLRPFMWTRRPPSAGRIVGPSLALLRQHPLLAERLQRSGAQVHVWVVNEPDDMRFVLSLGVDAVITDEPGLLLHMLGRGRPSSSSTG
jgi:glycerophosphoryl diester phosphodiesterase